MQSAEELAFEIASYDPGLCSIKEISAALIRARDREIIGICEKTAKEVLLDYGMDSGTLMVKDLVLALAQVLRDLG